MNSTEDVFYAVEKWSAVYVVVFRTSTPIAECNDKKDAKRIAKALNEAEGL
jgi:hypothetical protein